MEKFHSQQDYGVFSKNYSQFEKFLENKDYSKEVWPIILLKWFKSQNYPYEIESHEYFRRKNIIYLIFPPLWIVSLLILVLGIFFSSNFLICFGTIFSLLIFFGDTIYQIWNRINLPSPQKEMGKIFKLKYPSKKKQEFDISMVKLLIIFPFDKSIPKFQHRKRFFIYKLYQIQVLFMLTTNIIWMCVNAFAENPSESLTILFRMVSLFLAMLSIFIQIFFILSTFNGNTYELDGKFKIAMASSLIDYLKSFPDLFAWSDLEIILFSGYESHQLKNQPVFQKILRESKEYQEYIPIFLDFGPYDSFFANLSTHQGKFRRISSSPVKSKLNIQNLLRRYLIHYKILPNEDKCTDSHRFSFLPGNFIRFTNQAGRYRWIDPNIPKKQILKFGEKFYLMLLDFQQTIEHEFENIFTPEFEN